MCGVINKIEWRSKDKGLRKEGRHKENLDKVESGTKTRLKEPLYTSIWNFRFISNSYSGIRSQASTCDLYLLY